MFGHKPNKADPLLPAPPLQGEDYSVVLLAMLHCCRIVFLFLIWNFMQHVMCWNTKRQRISFINIHTV
jgi:hypothetical protein